MAKPNSTNRAVDSTFRKDNGQPVKGPSTPTANTRIDTTLNTNQPIEPQPNGSENDDAMARSEQWADGTATQTSKGNTRADQARPNKPPEES